MKGRALSVENSTQLYWTLLAATHPLLERYDGAISGAPPRSPLGQSLSREKSGADAARPISTGGRGLVCRDFFDFGGIAGALTGLKPSGETEATVPRTSKSRKLSLIGVTSVSS
jgi:hypothetical protein